MKNISHTRVIDNSTNNIVKEMNKRAKKQNRAYTIIFLLLGVFILFYFAYIYSVARYDGFIVIHNSTIRHIDNIVVVDYNVKPGDLVKEGDTLYSYININYTSRISDPYVIFETDGRKRDAIYRRDKLKSEYIEQKRALDSLQIIIGRTKNDVKLGVSTKEFLEELQWQNIQAYEKMENTQRLINQEQGIINNLNTTFEYGQRIESISAYSHNYSKEHLEIFGSAYKHRIAYVDMIIVDIDARHGVLVMDGEPIITYMPYNNPEMLDIHVKMLLTPKEFSNVDAGMIFDVYIGDDKVGDVQSTYSSTYIKNSNSKKQSGAEYEYSHNNKEIIVRAEFLDKKTLVQKYQVDGFPITLKKIRWKQADQDYIQNTDINIEDEL